MQIDNSVFRNELHLLEKINYKIKKYFIINE